MTIFNRICVFICAAFPTYTVDTIRDMTGEEIFQTIALAEKILDKPFGKELLSKTIKEYDVPRDT